MSLISQLRQSEFFRHVATLTAGTFVAQALTVLMTPVLSRLYSPENYAAFAIFTSLVAQVSVGASLRLEMALPTVHDDREAKGLIRLAFRIIILVSVLTFISIGAYLWFNNRVSGTRLLFLLAVPAIFLTAALQVLNYYSTRQRTYRLNSLSRIILSLSTGIVSMLFGWMGWGADGLIMGTLFGLTAGTLVLWYPLRRAVRTQSDEAQNFPRRHYFRKFRSYIFVNTPHALVDTLEVSGILLLMNKFYSESEIGSYFFAYRLLKLPVALIGAAVFQVFYQRMAAARNDGRPVTPMIRAVYLRMALLGLPVFLLVMLFSTDLFPFVFGKKWVLAGSLAGVMAPWLFFNFIASSASGVIYLYNGQRKAFLIAIFDISVRLGLLFYGGHLFGFGTMVKLLTLISCSTMIFATWWYYHITSKNEHATSLQ